MAAGFTLTVRAIDQVTAVLDKISGRMQQMRDRTARAFAPLNRLSASMKQFSDVSGITRASQAIGNMGRSAMDALGTITRMGLGLSALTAGGVIAGISRLSTAWAAFGSTLGRDSRRIGTTATNLHRFQGGARIAGASAEDMTSSLIHLGDTMQQAVAGTNIDAMRSFQTLKIGIHETEFRAKSGAERFEDVAEALSKIQSPAIRARYGVMLLGGSYERLATYIKDGREGIQRYNRAAERHGLVNEAAVLEAQKLQEAQVELGLAFTGVGNAIMQHVGPVLTPLIQQFTTYISANRDWIALGMAERFKQLDQYLKGESFADLKQRTENWGGAIGWVIKKLGGVNNVIEGLFVLMAARFAINMIAPFAAMAAAIGRVGLAMAGLTTGAAAAGLASLTRLLAIPGAVINNVTGNVTPNNVFMLRGDSTATAATYQVGSPNNSLAANTWSVVEGVYDGTNVIARVGANATSANTPSDGAMTNATTVRIGNRQTSGGKARQLAANVAEIIVCNAVLTTAERTDLINWINSRYALSAV